jgi:hypothetical protein
MKGLLGRYQIFYVLDGACCLYTEEGLQKDRQKLIHNPEEPVAGKPRYHQ